MQIHFVTVVIFFLLPPFYGTRTGGQCSLSQRHRPLFLWSRLLPQVRPFARKRFVGEVLRCCPEQPNGVFVPFIDEIGLADFALSCHFALDVLCYKEGGHDSA